MPVYQTNSALVDLETMRATSEVQALMVNAYFLYKNRETRHRFNAGLKLAEHVGFSGLLMTDSGAFQGFARKLLLDNVKIIRFQDMISTDISSPLDLVTPPGDSRRIAEKKMYSTIKRIEKGLKHTSNSTLAGVQQGGKYLDLRRTNIEELVQLGCQYIALGSLVPFFTAKHDLTFAGQVIRDAREIAGPDVTIHVYGAGDPVDLPLMSVMGADVFDSSSYAHYARKGAYMTPFGAIDDVQKLKITDYECECQFCASSGPDVVIGDVKLLAGHNFWTICDSIRRIRELDEDNRLSDWIDEMLPVHQQLFPESQLPTAWKNLNG